MHKRSHLKNSFFSLNMINFHCHLAFSAYIAGAWFFPCVFTPLHSAYLAPHHITALKLSWMFTVALDCKVILYNVVTKYDWVPTTTFITMSYRCHCLQLGYFSLIINLILTATQKHWFWNLNRQFSVVQLISYPTRGTKKPHAPAKQPLCGLRVPQRSTTEYNSRHEHNTIHRTLSQTW